MVKETAFIMRDANIRHGLLDGSIQKIIIPIQGTYWHDTLDKVERVNPSLVRVYFNGFQMNMVYNIGEFMLMKAHPLSAVNTAPIFAVERIHVLHRKYLRGKVALACGARSEKDNSNLALAYPGIMKGAYVLLLTLKR